MPDFDLEAAMAPDAPDVRVPVAYEVVDIGIDNIQYFQGVGRGNFDEVFVGFGYTPSEALEDALNRAVMDWDVESVVSPYTAAHDAEYCVATRNRAEWEGDFEHDSLDPDLTPEEKADELDALYQQDVDAGYGQDIGYFVAVRLRGRSEDDV